MAQGAKDIRRRRAGLVGDRIAGRRAELEQTQAELAEVLQRLGVPVSHATVSTWEWGRPRIALDQLLALAVALQCTTTYLLGLTEDPDKWEPDGSLEEATRV